MTRTEHLLTILAEECAEVAQRATKALRFGLWEIQPGHSEANAERIMGEYSDILATVEMLCDEGKLPRIDDLRARMDTKKVQVEHFLKYSAELGTLEPAP